MPDTDSANSGPPDAEVNVPESHQAPKVHPFFLPLSAKRAHASLTADKQGDSAEAAATPAVDSQQPKRPRQKVTGITLASTTAASPAEASSTGGEKRGRKPKSSLQTIQGSAVAKSAKIHSFFTVNTKRSAVQSAAVSMQQKQQQQPGCTDVEGIGSVTLAVDADITKSDLEAVVATSTSDAVSAYSTPLSEAPKPRRFLFRSTGIPAPYPTEHTHIPYPKFTSFEPKEEHTQSRFTVGSIDAVALQSSLSSLAYARPIDSINGGCAQWQQYLSSATRTEKLSGYILAPETYTSIRATPARIIADAATMPRVPVHLQFAVPFLESLYNQDVQPDRSAAATQLLAQRFQPKRASEVLGNRRSVLRLHSWIEGMRLKRPSSTLEKEALTVRDKAVEKPVLCFGRGSRRVAKGRFKSSSSDSESESSDDFMPKRTSRSRRVIDSEMEDVMAWAQSDGTINSVRELKRTMTRKHRRQGSSGSASETESFLNVILLEGPSGSGKTAAVYACAEESGFEVYEIHPGQRRSGKDVLAVLEDVILSHTISNSTGSGNARTAASATDSSVSGAVNQLLILIEEVDVLFEQDIRLWPALKQLALKSRRPIVLTCTDLNCVRRDSFSFESVLRFTRPSESMLVPYCFLLCLSEDVLVSPVDLVQLCRNTACDINRILCELDIVIRQTRAQQQPMVSCSNELSDSTRLDLGGTLSWLFNPLDPGETPESRYSFWMDLIGSVQPATRDGTCNVTWFHMWPDAPPTFGDFSLSDATTANRPSIETAHLNSFYAHRTRAAAAVASGTLSAASTLPHSDVSISLSPGLLTLPVLVPSVPKSAERPDFKETQSNQTQNHSETTMLDSDLEQMAKMTAALDTLSLSLVHTSETPVRRECQMEPLHSYIAPMLDGCLEVNYVVLDFDVLTRHNTTFLPDSSNATGQRTTTELDNYLTSSASASILETLSVEMEQKAKIDDISRTLESQDTSAPFTPPSEPSQRVIVRKNLDNAVDFVSLRLQRYEPDRIVETASYLSQMVIWDWIHKGKVPPPRHQTLESEAQSEYTPNSDNGFVYRGIQRLYRISNKPKRVNTYRAHIKRMPAEMQQFIVDWGSFE